MNGKWGTILYRGLRLTKKLFVQVIDRSKIDHLNLGFSVKKNFKLGFDIEELRNQSQVSVSAGSILCTPNRSSSIKTFLITQLASDLAAHLDG